MADKVRVSLEYGKYVFTIDNGYQVSCTRYGEPWLLPGNALPLDGKAMMCLLYRIEELEKVAAAAVEIEYILRDASSRKDIDSFTAQPLQVALREAEIPLTPDEPDLDEDVF